ncbi:hypothetical protein CIW49_07800 [Mycolicibacterium sp. P1-18]|uniref:hypothetical protein n=1 Tax=Mycolicibacterium sp. P1-18 TaxID=2024615 RepID=UPI0011F0B808|nr:hypothetical protein [Mycolicibacterium sp. P1-18]KAA0099512.1 hypothetical protein CIW49_07800 [Mycolicibacterium sp. P1-18]
MSDTTPIRPEDVLADGVEVTTFDGVDVRKGSVAAFVANARELARLAPGDAGRDALEGQLRALAPALRAVGLLEVFAPRSPDVAAILDGR